MISFSFLLNEDAVGKISPGKRAKIRGSLLVSSFYFMQLTS